MARPRQFALSDRIGSQWRTWCGRHAAPSEARQVALYGLSCWAGPRLDAIAVRMELGDRSVGRRVSVLVQRLATDFRFQACIARLAAVKVKT